MTRLWTEGFEGGDTLMFQISDGTNSNSTSNVRSGARCFNLNGATNGAQRLIGSSPGEWFSRFSFFSSSVPPSTPIFHFYTLDGGARIISLTSVAGGFIAVKTNNEANTIFTTTYPLVPSVQYLIELHVKLGGAGVGVTELKIDGIVRGTNSALANNQGGSTVNRICWMGQFSQVQIDDIALNDTNGSVDNSWCNDGRIVARAPNATGTYSNWTPSTGANWQNVDEVPPNSDTDYNATAAATTKDSYNIAASALSGITIRRAWTEMVARNTVADGSTAKMFIRTYGTDYDDTNGLQALTATYARYRSAEWVQNPTTSGTWTTTEIDDLEIGVST